MTSTSSPTIRPPASCWSCDGREPEAALAGAVDVGVDGLADDHEAHAEEHAEQARGEDVADLPQLAAAAAGAWARAPTTRRASRSPTKLACCRAWTRVVADGRLEREREVPACRAPATYTGDRHERAPQRPERRAQPPAPRERHERRAREQEGQHGVAHAREQERRRQVGDQQVLRHVRRQQVVAPARRSGETNPISPQRDADVPQRLLAAGHRDAAPPQDRHGAQVEPLGDRERGEHARIERSCVHGDARRLRARGATSTSAMTADRHQRRRRAGSGRPRPRSAAGSARRSEDVDGRVDDRPT